jgi:hypothetical protein
MSTYHDIVKFVFDCRCGVRVVNPTHLDIWLAGDEKCCSPICQQAALRKLAAAQGTPTFRRAASSLGEIDWCDTTTADAKG